MGGFDDEFDFVVVGSGGGSVPASLVIKNGGYAPLIVEKQAVIGGTSAFSGGVIWIPNNHHLNEAGGGDSHERSRTYLDQLVGDAGLASTPAKRDAYIRYGAEMVEFLERRGMEFVRPQWPDYYDNLPGGSVEGRSLTVRLFDMKNLGEWADKLAGHPITGSLPITGQEARFVGNLGSTWMGKLVLARVFARVAVNKVLKRTVRGAGNALQGRLFQIALREQVPIWTETPVKDFIVEDGRVVGVLAERVGKPVRIGARHGVLINAGGFAHNLAMREKYQPKPTSVNWTMVNRGDTGEMIQAAMALGAQVALMDEAHWLANSFDAEGNLMGMHSPTNIGKPFCVVVNSKGERFANESNSYMEFGQRMYEADAVPAWAVMDSRHRKRYLWGSIPPGRTPAHLIESGYMVKADTLAELARRCSIDSQGLAKTVARFNGFARSGVDEDYRRGESAFNHHFGDPTHRPNPNLGGIERAPFYAVRIWPGDVGTAGGLVTDEHARVLREDGSVIAGLYATGNSTAAALGRCYPGAGASVGPSMTFGYIAALHASAAAAASSAPRSTLRRQ